MLAGCVKRRPGIFPAWFDYTQIKCLNRPRELAGLSAGPTRASQELHMNDLILPGIVIVVSFLFIGGCIYAGIRIDKKKRENPAPPIDRRAAMHALEVSGALPHHDHRR